jgi:hypothetical protein
MPNEPERCLKDAMISQLRKRKWVALGMLLALPLVVLWFLSSPPPPVRVTFLHATNDPSNGRVGVIELVNPLNEKVTVMGAWYVPAKRKDQSIANDTPLVSIDGDMSRLAAGSTNIVQVSIPTNGGPYRLVCQCVRESKDPSRSQGTLRYRTIFFISPWLHPSQVTLVRLCGGFFAASQSIDPSQ